MTSTDEESDSQMLRCVECGQFYPARADADELVPAGTRRGGRCSRCGGNEFERVVLGSEYDRDHN